MDITAKFLYRYYENEALEEDRQKKMYESDRHNSYWQNVRFNEIISIFKIISKENETFLDVGCAEGLYLETLKKIDKDIDMIGIDIANNYLKKIKAEDIKLIQGDVNNLPFKTNTFDIVLCSETLEHVINPKNSIYELYRISKKYIIISVPGHTPFYYIGKYMGITDEEKMSDKFSSPGKGHINELDVKYIEKLLSEFKFKIMRKKTYCYLPPEIMKKCNVPLIIIRIIDRIINYIPYLNSFGLVQVLVIEKT